MVEDGRHVGLVPPYRFQPDPFDLRRRIRGERENLSAQGIFFESFCRSALIQCEKRVFFPHECDAYRITMGDEPGSPSGDLGCENGDADRARS